MVDVNAGATPDSISTGDTFGGSRGGHAGGYAEIFAEIQIVETIVPVRPPQFGIPVAQKRAVLRQLLPNGSDSYVGLFTTMPELDGTGGVEASGSGYARVVHSTWYDSIVGHVATRLNLGAIRFAALTAGLTVRGWGVWDGADDLVAFGPTRNADLRPRAFSLVATDEPGFTSGALRVRIQ